MCAACAYTLCVRFVISASLWTKLKAWLCPKGRFCDLIKAFPQIKEISALKVLQDWHALYNMLPGLCMCVCRTAVFHYLSMHVWIHWIGYIQISSIADSSCIQFCPLSRKQLLCQSIPWSEQLSLWTVHSPDRPTQCSLGTSTELSCPPLEIFVFRRGPMGHWQSPIRPRAILVSIYAMSALRLSLWLHKYQWQLEVLKLK